MKRRRIVIVGLMGIFLVVFWRVASCERLRVCEYVVRSEKVTEEIRLAVVADLHSTFYGEEQEELVEAIRAGEPDVVLLVGDLADDKVPHEGTEIFLEKIGRVYPCFYVSGNHEYWSGEIDRIKEMIASYGVTVLERENKVITVGEQRIEICGVDDLDGFDGFLEGWKKQLTACEKQLDGRYYSVLLSHRPELVEYYRDRFDLVVSGHAHGGQVRIPGVLNGLLAPNQGWFPAYAGGRYELGETVMIVSRGLCLNWLPRIFNRPELVFVNLQSGIDISGDLEYNGTR